MLNFLRKGNARGTLRGAGGHIGHKAEVGRKSKRSGAGNVFFFVFRKFVMVAS